MSKTCVKVKITPKHFEHSHNKRDIHVLSREVPMHVFKMIMATYLL
jgi:hypothetical protein